MQRPSVGSHWVYELKPLPHTHPNRFDDTALWFCTSHITGKTLAIHGGLAQVLQAYPHHFRMVLFSAPSVT